MPAQDTPPTTPRRLVVTSAARRAVLRVRREIGPQAVLVSWPAGATYVPERSYVPSTFDVIVGHVARCPIYADIRQLGFYNDRFAVLDVRDTDQRHRPILRVRPAPAATPAGRTEP